MHGMRHHGALRRAAWAGRRFGRFGEGPRWGRTRRRRRRAGDWFRVGRMLAQGDLKLLALALIAEQPRHGYELIKLIEDKTRGAYSPSPGVVYPTLTFLEEAGYVTAEAEGAKKRYTITDGGPRLSRRESRHRRHGAGAARSDRREARAHAPQMAERDGEEEQTQRAEARRCRAREFARRRGEAARGRERTATPKLASSRS